MSTLTHTTTLVVETCWCGMAHAVPEELVDHQQRQHRDGVQQTGIYCPLGHVWVRSGKGEAERQRERAAQLERNLQVARETAAAERDLREDTERRLAAQKGATTRAKKRHAAGVCPCCKRSFAQLRRHIASQHPEYDPAKDA